jgi:hypothetical protein
MRFLVVAVAFVCAFGGLASSQGPPVGVAPYEIVAIIEREDGGGLTVWHLNEKEEVAGWWGTGPNCDDPIVSFVWSKGEFRYIGFPDAFSTTAEGVNNRGFVTGGVIMEKPVRDPITDRCSGGLGHRQGYFMSPDGEFHTLPWVSLHSVVNNITPNGWMTGPTVLCEPRVAAGCQLGFLYNGRDEPLFLDPPGCRLSIDARDVNARGDVVGLCGEAWLGPTHGFRYRDGAYEFIDFPGAFQTEALGTNSAGDVIGQAWLGAAGGHVEFIRRGNRFAVIELVGVEGLVLFRVYDINEAGTIAGSIYYADGLMRGFIARPIR